MRWFALFVGLGLCWTSGAHAAPELGPYRAACAERRARLVARLPEGGAVLLRAAGESRAEVDDTFRQDSDFWYLTGFPEPEAVAVLLKARGGQAVRFVLFVAPRNPQEETWNGLRAGPDGARTRYGADEAYPIGELWNKLPELLRDASALYFRDGRDREFASRLWEAWRRADAQSTSLRPIADVGPLLHDLRLVKDETEIALLRQAVSLSVDGHRRALSLVRPGADEHALKGAMLETCLSGGGARMGYAPIVGSGPNSVILHYDRAERRMQAGEMLVNDTACEYGLYTADITRSAPVSGRFSSAQREIYDLVLAAQKAGIARVRPGAAFHEIYDATVEVVVDGLLRLGLLQGRRDELIRSRAYREFYPHGSSHWIGLNVHDAGSYESDPGVSDRLERAARARVKLRPGMALTVEPGIYIPAGARVDPRYWNIGVRIEDDLLVTADGAECLSCALPREAAEIEAALAGGR